MQSKNSRLKLIWGESRWILIGILWVSAMCLGYLGFYMYSRDNQLNASPLDLLYQTLQLIPLASGLLPGTMNWMLEIARFLLPALAAYTVFQAFVQLFSEQVQIARLWRIRDHVIVCGLGRKGGKLVEELVAQGEKVVVIEKETASENIRKLRSRGVIIINGDARDQFILESARIQRAHHLFAFLGDDRENIAIALAARQISQRPRNGSLTCVTHLSSFNLLTLLDRKELSRDPGIPFDLEVFNIFDRGARNILEQPGNNPLELGQSRLLIVGFGRMAEALVLAIAREHTLKEFTSPIDITVLDGSAQENTARFLAQNPRVSRACALHPVDLEVDSADFINRDILALNGQAGSFQHIFICISDPILGMQAALSIVDRIKQRNIPILIRLEEDNGISMLISEHKGEHASQTDLTFFNIYRSACSAELLLGGIREQLARDLHQNYRATAKTLSLPSDQPWESLPEYLKDSNRKQVDRIQAVLRSCGYELSILKDWNAARLTFAPAEIEKMAQKEHELWCDSLRSAGWKYGERRDDGEKIHPGLTSWQDLPESYKEKNRNYMEKLPRLLALTGIQIDSF